MERFGSLCVRRLSSRTLVKSSLTLVPLSWRYSDCIIISRRDPISEPCHQIYLLSTVPNHRAVPSISWPASYTIRVESPSACVAKMFGNITAVTGELQRSGACCSLNSLRTSVMHWLVMFIHFAFGQVLGITFEFVDMMCVLLTMRPCSRIVCGDLPSWSSIRSSWHKCMRSSSMPLAK